MSSTTQPRLQGKRIAILATNGVEQAEILQPRRALESAGAKTTLVSPSTSTGTIRSWEHDHWAQDLPVDMALAKADADSFDALFIPGGVMNADALRAMPDAIAFVRAFAFRDKPISAICHGPWLLIEAGLARGRSLTSWHSLKTDLLNAGADWTDREVVTDEGIVTSRKVSDLPAFCAAMLKAFAADTTQAHDAEMPNYDPPRTTKGGWTSPKFGSAGSGGAELEPGPEKD